MPPKKKSNAGVIALIAVLAVLVLGGGGVTVYLLGQDATPAAKTPTTSETDGPSDPPGPTGEPVPTQTTPAPDSTSNIRLVKTGDCVRNDGSNSKPKLVITECEAKTYEVLARIDGATTGDADAKKKCSKVSGYTNYYYSNDALDELDFVLCLKRR